MKYFTNRKKALMFLMSFIMMASLMTFPSQAATRFKIRGVSRTYYGTRSKVYFNGRQISNTARYGVYFNDNFLIPYRSLLVCKGPKVRYSYNKAKRKLVLTRGKVRVSMFVNSKKIFVNGVRKSDLNTPPLSVKMEGTNLIVVPIKRISAELGLGYSFSSSSRNIYLTSSRNSQNNSTAAPAPAQTPATPASFIPFSGSTANLQASAFKYLTPTQFIKLLGPIAQEDYHRTGVLASVTLAQAINESGWGKTPLAQAGNNIFGMKISLSGNSWSGSVWDQESCVPILTTEEYGGRMVKITANFRQYPSVAHSIADHSAYLLYAKNGSDYRYKGLTSTKSYAKQLRIIQKGGYCTWSSYISELTTIIKKYNLTQYDK